MELVTPHLKSVLKNYQHSATNSLHGPGTATLVQSSNKKDLRDEPLEIPTSIIQQPLPPPFPIQQMPILTTPDTSRSERTETMLEGESISCFVVGGEKRLCLPQVLNSVLREFSLHQINQECDRLQIYCSRCTPEQLNELKNTGILPSGAPSCGLITKTDAERLCSALLHSTTSISSIPLSKTGGALSFRVYHECFGKCTGVCTPAWYAEFGGRCIECVECRGLFTPQQFVCHAHRPLENRTCHWGFDSGNWRAYLHVCRDESDREKCARLLDALKERHDLPISAVAAASAIAAVAIEGNISNGLKRKQINLLEPEMLKTEPIEIPLKKSKIDDYAMKSKLEDYAVKSKLEDYAMKSKLDDYAVKTKLDDYAAAYLYAAAAMDPIYIHKAMYEQWSINRQFSAFRPVSNMFANNGKDTCKSEKAPRHQKYYKDQPPVLQNPERVVPLSESERFERSFQPNVALAPPLPAPPIKSNKHLARHHYDNYNHHHQTKEKTIKIEEQEYSPVDDETQKLGIVHENCPIKSNVISSQDESQCLDLIEEKETIVDRTHSAIVDSTVSVVQSIGVNINPARYNSEIELSTDTDDSLSDMSSDNPRTRKVSPDIQRVMDGLVDVPMETRDRVVDIVRRMVFEHNRAMQQSHEKDERIAQLEQRVLELEASLRQATGGATSVRSVHSEYDVTVTSSRTEMPAQDECTSEDIANDDIGSSCAPESAATPITICSPQAQVQVQEDSGDVLLHDHQGIREEVTSETVVVSPLLCSKTSAEDSEESNIVNSIGITETNEPE